MVYLRKGIKARRKVNYMKLGVFLCTCNGTMEMDLRDVRN
jgi:hypothetical protein